MHLLYLDDSGSVSNPADNYVILAGLAVFERQPHWLAQQLNEIASQVWPDEPERLEFRGIDILSGGKRWRGIFRLDRQMAYRSALQLVANSRQVRLFGAAVHKNTVSPRDAMEYAFEQVASRFDMYLMRLHKRSDTQRGLIVLDKSTYETSIQGLAQTFRTEGHQWGQLKNLAEVPLFVDSRATRMIQYADLLAHAMRRFYERGDDYLFKIFADKFDSEGGVNHGLIHTAPLGTACTCPSCRKREGKRTSRVG